MCISFLQITQKIPTKDIVHWLELITEMLSFLKIFSVRKATTQLFIISETLPEYRQKNCTSGIFWASKSKWQIIHTATYIALFLPDSSNCFFTCLVPYIPICLYYFLILCFYLHLRFPSLLATRHILQFTMFLIRFHYNLPVILQR